MENATFLLYSNPLDSDFIAPLATRLEQGGFKIVTEPTTADPLIVDSAKVGLIFVGANGLPESVITTLTPAINRAVRDAVFQPFAGENIFRLLIAALPSAPAALALPDPLQYFPLVKLVNRDGSTAIEPLLTEITQPQQPLDPNFAEQWYNRQLALLAPVKTELAEAETAETELATIEADLTLEEQVVQKEAALAIAYQRVRARTRTAFWAVGVALVLTLLTITLLISANTSNEQREAALREKNSVLEQQKLALSRQLSANAAEQLPYDHELALRLAIEAVKVAPTDEAESVLRRALLQPLPRATINSGGQAISKVAFSADGRYMLTINGSPNSSTPSVRASVWDISNGTRINTLPDNISENINIATISPNGKMVVIGDYRNARGFDIATGKVLFETNTGRDVMGVVFSSDSQLIAVQTFYGAVNIYDSSSGKSLSNFPGEAASSGLYYQGRNNSVGFRPDNKAIAFIYDKTLRVMDIQSGQVWFEQKSNLSKFTALAWQPDGKVLATGDESGAIQLWDAANNRTSYYVSRSNGDAIQLLAFSNKGQNLVAASNRQQIQMWRVNNWQEIYAGVVGNVPWNAAPDAPFWSEDGRFFTTISDEGVARLYDTSAYQIKTDIRGSSQPVIMSAITPDGKTLVTANSDGKIRLWDLGNRPQPVQLKERVGRAQVRFSPDGRKLVVPNISAAYIYDTTSGNQLVSLTGHEGTVISANFSPDGRYVVTGSSDNTARVWDARNGQPLFTLTGHSGTVSGAIFSPDGKYILTYSTDNTTRLWDVATGQPVKFVKTEETIVYSAEFSPDSKLFLTASANNVRVWAVDSAALVAILPHTSVITAAHFSPDSKLIATGSDNKIAKIWSISNQREISFLSGHTSLIRNVIFSPDSRRLLTVSKDNTARLSDVNSGRELAVLSNNNFGLDNSNAEFSPNGKLILTSGFVTDLWDASNGQFITRLPGASGSFYSNNFDVPGSTFSPDGRQIAVSNREGAIQIFDCEICGTLDDLLTVAQTRAPRDLTPDERARYLKG